LKRDRTPRDVVAQVLDYGSWVQGLTLEQISAAYSTQNDEDFAAAFAARFSTPLPDVFNADQRLTIVASKLDTVSECIVTYLAENYDVPVNAVFFRYFADEATEYLARTWLVAPEETEATVRSATPHGKVRPWNGKDFYVAMGNMEQGPGRRNAGRKYGFVGAGGGSWYWKPLRNLTAGKRVFAYVGGAGYVGVGEVTGTVVPLRDLETEIDGTIVRVAEQSDVPEDLRQRTLSGDEEITEFAVPVRWIEARPVMQAVSERGLFASQIPACKLKDEHTIQVVTRAFGLGVNESSA
jgi:hypothetical protein